LGEGGSKNRDFFGAQRVPFGPKKMALVMDMPPSKPLRTAPYINNRYINS
jgi:hypothetical protein